MESGPRYLTTIDSPIGKLLLVGTEAKLTHLGFQDGPKPMAIDSEWIEDARPFADTVKQLAAYFNGALMEFSVSIAPEGTAFQRGVWNALLEIPYGETTSYGELARHIGNPKAARAVGAANGQNPIPIIVPCHRVIGRTGSMVGFGGGISIKEKLLAIERRYGGAQLEWA